MEFVRKADREGKEQAKSMWECETLPMHPMRLAKEVNDFMDREDDIVVADGGDTCHLDGYDPDGPSRAEPIWITASTDAWRWDFPMPSRQN